MPFLIPANETQLDYIKKNDVYRSDNKLEEDVTQLIEWLSKQPHLPNVTDRKWLLHFITGCKFSLQRSKQLIELHFISRTEYPEFFGSYKKEEINPSNKFWRISLFPKLTPEGYRVYCSRTLPTTDNKGYDATHIFKLGLTLLLLQLKEVPMYGNVFLYDMRYLHLSHFLAFTPTVVKNLFKCCYHSFPLRVKSIHILNPPTFISRILVFFKMLMTDKLKQRIFVHNSLEELYQYIPKDVLPEIYGGIAGKLERFEDYTHELFMNNIEWLEAQPKADLSKLPKRLKSKELNMNGTFKKLEID